MAVKKSQEENSKNIKISKLGELGLLSWDKKFAKKPKLNVIPTGSYRLNRALGVGGWMEGKIIEIYGADSSGKSTLALHAISEAQKQNKTTVYVDLENTLNFSWAKKIGVNLEKVYISTPSNGEEVFSLINALIKTKEVDLIVVDSVAAMVPNVEMQNNIEDQTMGLHARLMSRGLRILQSNLIDSKTTILFINQVREKIGNSPIPMTVTTGGRALRYAASIRVEIRRCESIKSDNNIVGFATKATIIKNKFSAPMTVANIALYFDSGFDYLFEIIHEALEKGIIFKKTSWFEYKGKNIAQGLSQFRKYLKENKEFLEKIEKELREKEDLN